MALTEEESRAIAYQQRQARIAANQTALAARLTGDGATRLQTQRNWQPVIDAQRDARDTGVDHSDCEENE